jgi:hypothetical protein
VATFAAVLAILGASCLAAIQLRARLPLFGSIVSKKLHRKLDRTDKRLALTSVALFLASLGIFVLSQVSR